ncbi:TPA: hypothetical protein ACH3X1_008910 [Trebouxia sp. C0004]
MAEVLQVPDVAVDVGDNSAATSLISEAAVADGQDLKLLDDSDAQGTSEEVSSLLPGAKAAAVISANAEGQHTPWFAWPLLFASLVAFSSAAVVFASIPDVPTFTLAAWRLQLTTCLLSPAAIYQYMQLSTADRKRLLRNILLVLASGAFLGVHFSFWVWAIHHTSLTHALLFSSAAPLLIAIGTLIMRKPISTGEILGTCLGMVGVLALTQANKVDRQVTLAGDFSAFLTAVFFCGYIIIGAHLRKWLPIFLYATPVTGFAALLLSIAALVVGEATFSGSGNTGLFGWMTDKAYLPKILYLAVVPGIVGHTGFNALLKWMPALLITLALTVEPLIGTFIGWSVGLAQIPGVWTYSGGAVLLVSTCIVVVAGDRRQQAAAAKESSCMSQKVFFEDASDHCNFTTDIELAGK